MRRGPGKGTLGAPPVLLEGLPLPGEDDSTVTGNSGGDVVLGGEDVAGAPTDLGLRKVIDLVLETTCVVFSTNKAMVYALRKKERKKESGVVRKGSGVMEGEDETEMAEGAVKVSVLSVAVVDGGIRGTQKMDKDEWMYESIMSEEADMDYQNEEACGANEPHVDCYDAFNTSQVFDSREDVLRWARSVTHENEFVAVIIRSNTNTGSRGRTSFVLIGCERSGEYRRRKKEFIRRDTGTRKCGCPFKLRCKPVVGGEGWMVKLANSLVGHPYVGRLTKAEKTLIDDMTKSMVKPRNILLILKEHNANSFTTIKQIYNARSVFRSSIRGNDLEMQHLMKLLERDQYICWHKIKDEDVVRDIFWCHPDAVKLVNACNLVFLIDNTYKTNWYRLPLLDFVGVTPIGMTFSTGFAYVECERVNNLVQALQRFRGLFLKRDVEVMFSKVILMMPKNQELRKVFKWKQCFPRPLYPTRDALPRVIVTDRDQALMNAVKAVFPYCTNSLCSFHINKNVKAKCISLIGKKNAWDYFDECLKKFEMTFSPWPMFVDYVKETWIIPHKEKKFPPGLIRVESAHSSLKRLLQNSLGDLCNILKHHLKQVHMSLGMSSKKKTLYRRLLGMVSSVLTMLARIPQVDCVVTTTLGLPCACELSKYVGGCIPLDSIHMFWRRLSFSDQGLCEPEVSIKAEIETISKRFKELDVCGKFTLKTKLWEIAYPDQNSMCPPPAKVNTKGAPKKPMSRNPRSTKRDPSYWEYVDAFESMQNSNSSVRRTASSSEQPNQRTMMPMLDQFQPFMHDFIDNIVDVKADGNCGYRSVASLFGMGEDSWLVVLYHLLKELGKFSEDYTRLFGGTERFEELRMSLHVDGLTKVTTNKWMNITDMGHVNASRYNVIVVSLSKQQSMTFFPLRSQPLANSSLHCIICISHVYDNHFVELHCRYEVYLKERCPLPPVALKFDISSGCTMDELKDLIKQVVPHGIPPYGIDHETQMVRRLFF
ncbi:PKS-NRPS hybrid synthetase [Glycine soja]